MCRGDAGFASMGGGRFYFYLTGGNKLMNAKLTFYLALVIAGSALLGVGEFFTIAGMILTALGLFLLLLEAIKK